MTGPLTGVVATLVEAWGEVRVHKARVVLSLVGVVLAVFAMTVITAAGDMARQASAEVSERQSGRPASLAVNAYGPGQPDGAAVTAAFDSLVERHEIAYASTVAFREQWVRLPSGSQLAQLRVVDQPYGDMHRVAPELGRWFHADDERRYAPTLVVNEALHTALGSPPVETNPTVVLGGERPVRAVVVGVVANEYREEMPSAFALRPTLERWTGDSSQFFGPPTLELWVPPAQADAFREQLPGELRAMLGDGTQVDVYRMDNDEFAGLDAKLRWGIRGVGALALALGSLGLVNIALVTVRHRIREIGIRRSFGATSMRVFWSVMLESVWATVVAGFIGVALAVAVVENVPPDLFGAGGIQDLPPFPVRAAVEGMVAACIVGALAGLVPAIIAVRVKVIDAIRY